MTIPEFLNILRVKAAGFAWRVTPEGYIRAEENTLFGPQCHCPINVVHGSGPRGGAVFQGLSMGLDGRDVTSLIDAADSALLGYTYTALRRELIAAVGLPEEFPREGSHADTL